MMLQREGSTSSTECECVETAPEQCSHCEDTRPRHLEVTEAPVFSPEVGCSIDDRRIPNDRPHRPATNGLGFVTESSPVISIDRHCSRPTPNPVVMSPLRRFDHQISLQTPPNSAVSSPALCPFSSASVTLTPAPELESEDRDTCELPGIVDSDYYTNSTSFPKTLRRRGVAAALPSHKPPMITTRTLNPEQIFHFYDTIQELLQKENELLEQAISLASQERRLMIHGLGIGVSSEMNSSTKITEKTEEKSLNNTKRNSLTNDLSVGPTSEDVSLCCSDENDNPQPCPSDESGRGHWMGFENGLERRAMFMCVSVERKVRGVMDEWNAVSDSPYARRNRSGSIGSKTTSSMPHLCSASSSASLVSLSSRIRNNSIHSEDSHSAGLVPTPLMKAALLKSIKSHSSSSSNNSNSNQSSNECFSHSNSQIVSDIRHAHHHHHPSHQSYFTFKIRRVGSVKFFSTVSRVLHIDLKNQDVFVCLNDSRKKEEDGCCSEITSKSVVTLDELSVSSNYYRGISEDSMTLSKQSSMSSLQMGSSMMGSSTNGMGGTMMSAVNQTPHIHHHQHHHPIHTPLHGLSGHIQSRVTRQKADDIPTVRLVDFFGDNSSANRAVLVFKSLVESEKEHDKLVFKSYTFESETKLHECYKLINRYVLGSWDSHGSCATTAPSATASASSSSASSMSCQRVINSRKLCHIEVSVQMDRMASRIAELLVQLWKKDKEGSMMASMMSDDDPRRRGRVELSDTGMVASDDKDEDYLLRTNAKFMVDSIVKIIIMIGGIIKRRINHCANRTDSTGMLTSSAVITAQEKTAEMKWLSHAVSRHVCSVWMDRRMVNDHLRFQSEMMMNSGSSSSNSTSGTGTPSGSSSNVISADNYSLDAVQKSRLHTETVFVIQQICQFNCRVYFPKNTHAFMF